jgi:hypothetical protein
MSASKKKLTARVVGVVLGGALLLGSGGGCGAPATGAHGHAPGDASVVAAAPGR